MSKRACHVCKGKGKFGEEECALCRGTGELTDVKTYKWGTQGMLSKGGGITLSGDYVDRATFDRVALDRDGWKIAEHEARHGIDECTICPHLGHGDPLVDSVAAELVWIREQLHKELEQLDSMNTNLTPYHKRQLQRIRRIASLHRCTASTKEGKPCRNIPSADGGKLCQVHYQEQEKKDSALCPKCGSPFLDHKATTVEQARAAHRSPHMWSSVECAIRCGGCGHTGPTCIGKEAAWKAWKRKK